MAKGEPQHPSRRHTQIKAQLSPAIAAKLQQAAAFHQQGQLTQAEPLYREIISRAPRHVGALQLLGVIAYQRGRFDEAERLISQALAIKPDYTDALNNRGLTLVALKRLDEALASYDKALAIKPDYTDALSNRGFALLELQRPGEALASYDKALAIKPDFAEALSNRGNALFMLKRLDEALASYDRALAIKPDYAEALYNRGNALAELKRQDEALASFDRALTIKPDYAEALYNRGNALFELKRPDEALVSFDRALAIRPDYAEALSNRGNALLELKRPDEALVSFDRALAIKPNYADALSNRGAALSRLKRLEEALASYDRALAIKPDYVEAWNDRGLALFSLKRMDEALASYDRALAIEPDYAEAHWNEALCRLSVGDFGRGWEAYEWRWRNAPIAMRRVFSQPLWLGEHDITGKTVLLHAEQGLGDTIQFCRYASLVAERGARVELEVQPALKSLLSGLNGVERVLAMGETLPAFDFHCPLLSLPLAFKTTLATIPAAVPYLKATPELVAMWQARLGEKTAPRIGLMWSGNPEHKNDHNRSIAPSRLAPLMDLDATLVSLQQDVRAQDRQWLADHPTIRHFGSDLRDFADTAALAHLMDLVISVDTSVAHLAGALGRQVWILLPFIGDDWRWLLHRDDSPWYPTARLFRQPAIDDWHSVIEHLANELQQRLCVAQTAVPRSRS